MALRNIRPILAPAILTLAVATAACGASSSPTAPQLAPTSLGAGNYSLIIFGTSTCLSSSGANGLPSSANVRVVLSSTAASDVWRVSVPGQSLTGEVALVNGQVQGWLRGSASSETMRLTTGGATTDAIAMESTGVDRGRYEGPVLVGTPRYEGLGNASGAYTTCSSNGFTLQSAP